MNILVVEDEVKIQNVLEAYFQKEGWGVITTGDGDDAIEKFKHIKFDLVILDRMIHGLQGEEVCKKIRKESNVPIIMITSKSLESDVIEGYNIGTDFYITKPFRVKEVVAQIHALKRRLIGTNNETADQYISFNNQSLKVNLGKREVYLNGRPVNLTTSQFSVLTLLIKNPGKVFSRNELNYEAQGYRYIGDGRSIDAHIKNIRKKIEADPKNPDYIVTVFGSGYKFTFEPDRRIN